MSGHMFLPDVIEHLGRGGLNYRWTIACMTPGANARVWPVKMMQGWKPILWYAKGRTAARRMMEDRIVSRPDKRFHGWGQDLSVFQYLVDSFSVNGMFSTRRYPATAREVEMSSESRVSGREAAVLVLRDTGKPMPVKELTAEAVKRVWPKMGGKTPEATIAAQIYMCAKKGVLFTKAGRGEIALLETFRANEGDSGSETSDESESAAVTPNSVVVRDGARDARPDPKPSRRKRQESVAA